VTNATSRRDAICEAALDLAAEGGNHRVTHQSIDQRLGIAKGSTSYYYRSRRALVHAAAAHLAQRSAIAFQALLDSPLGSPADLVCAYVDELLGPRRRDALARLALFPETADNPELRHALGGCLFSTEAAQALFGAAPPEERPALARDLVSLLEGLLVDRLYGARSFAALEPGTAASRYDIRTAIERLL
jgi:AcrR family transcriptional regulator